jgi:hypothetical protein
MSQRENVTTVSRTGTVGEGTDSGWDRFWFSPSKPRRLCQLRIAAGTLALWFFLGHTFDLQDWFGPRGMLPTDTVKSLRPDPYRWSILPLFQESGGLWVVHGMAVFSAACMVLGLFSRTTTMLTWLFVLSYVHRAPMLTGTFEPVLTLILGYLWFAPVGNCYSVDRWWRARRGRDPQRSDGGSTVCTLVCRLIQVHTAMLYGLMGLSKLGGVAGSTSYDGSWWRGEAVWWLITRSESRLIDLTMLHAYPLVVNVWTHAIVAFELAFAVLIWNRRVRPLLLTAGCILWPLTGLVTGSLSYALAMLSLNLAFARTDDGAE